MVRILNPRKTCVWKHLEQKLFRNYFEKSRVLTVNHKKQGKCMHNSIMFHCYVDTKYLKGEQIKGTGITKGAPSYDLTELY